MNTAVKELWCAALESGEYQQGKRFLRIGDDDVGFSYCCLGVLCDLHAKSTGQKWLSSNNSYLYHKYHLPTEVIEWADLPKDKPSLIQETEQSLPELNDGGNSFVKIAELIREYL